MTTDGTLQYMPRSFKLWAQIEEKAQQRAEERFIALQEIQMRNKDLLPQEEIPKNEKASKLKSRK